MTVTEAIRTTPLTNRADRSDERVRLIEESVLMLRGDWPAVGAGLCERVNREVGLIVSTPREAEQAIAETCEEALGLVGSLYGPQAVEEVKRLAAVDPHPRREHRDRRSRRRFGALHLSS